MWRRLLFVSLLFMPIFSVEIRDDIWRRSLATLKEGDGRRGSLKLVVEDIAVDEGISLKVLSASCDGFRNLDIIDARRDEDSLKALLRFPQLLVDARVEVTDASSESSFTGEGIFRFLDAELIVDAAAHVDAASVSTRLGTSTVAVAFDLNVSDPQKSRLLQDRLRLGRDVIIGVLRRAIELRVGSLVSDALPVERRALAVVPAPAISNADDLDPVTKANRFVDQLLKDQRDLLRENIGQIKLPDSYFEFSKTIMFVETHGWARLTHGHLDNLHAIVRKGDCGVVVEDNVLKLAVDLGVDNVKGAYFIEVKFGVFSLSSDLKVEISSIEIVLTGLHSFRETLKKGDETVNILNFDLSVNAKVNLGDVDIDVNIFGPLDWLFNLIAEKVVGNIKGKVQDMIKDPLKSLIKTINGT